MAVVRFWKGQNAVNRSPNSTEATRRRVSIACLTRRPLPWRRGHGCPSLPSHDALANPGKPYLTSRLLHLARRTHRGGSTPGSRPMGSS